MYIYYIYKRECTPCSLMLTAVYIAKIWKQPKCP